MSSMPNHIPVMNRAIASYYYCADYYNSMSDWRYLHVCNSTYQPGPMEKFDLVMEDPLTKEAYEHFIEWHE